MKIGLYLAVLTVLIGLAVGIPATFGPEPSAEASRAQQLVTRDYGSADVGQSSVAAVPAGETVMRMLQREFAVETRFGGGFVQSIEGRAGGRRDGRPIDWFYYVNGIEASVGAATRDVAAGDRIWWDLHDWGTITRVPAVVGSFPEPFLSGIEGKRRPVRIDCSETAARLCDEVTTRLDEAGITAVARSALNGPAGSELLRIVVGPWDEVRRDPTLRQLERAPRSSGVFARFLDSGRRLELYDATGRVERTLGAGTGLIAATRFEGQQPTWVVTGTDAAGAAAAATAMREETLSRRFALAVQEGRPVSVPIDPPDGSP